MKLRAASRSSSFSNATSRSGADPNMWRNDHSAKRLPLSSSRPRSTRQCSIPAAKVSGDISDYIGRGKVANEKIIELHWTALVAW